MLLNRADLHLLVVDVQERLMPAMHEPDRVLGRIGVLLAAARRLDIPVTVTEQYPQGLGPTVEPVRAALGNDAPIFAKTAFSAAGDPPTMARIEAVGRRQVVVVGVEAHVCVLQTALGLKARGYEPLLVADAVSSRKPQSVELAVERLRGAGVPAVDVEMVLFEALGAAGTPEFKELSRLIR